MIGLRMTVPFACWRKAHARELVETEAVPPPATCYGALLSLVGEWDRGRHVGCRVTAGLLNTPRTSTVLRTFWQIKKRSIPQGSGANAGPDFHQLVVSADLVVFCDSSEERGGASPLEERLRAALNRPDSVERAGAWSLGESTHLVNDLWLLPAAHPPGRCRVFLAAEHGRLTLPVWVDHVGFAGTRHVVGDLVELDRAPEATRVPRIEPPG